MHWIVPIFSFFLVGCAHQVEDAVPQILIEDKENKELELVYLHEIKLAQENNDTDAYQFYFDEYLAVPRLDIPEELKEHPSYFIGGDKVKY